MSASSPKPPGRALDRLHEAIDLLLTLAILGLLYLIAAKVIGNLASLFGIITI